jgi:hypothetical protein
MLTRPELQNIRKPPAARFCVGRIDIRDFRHSSLRHTTLLLKLVFWENSSLKLYQVEDLVKL